MPVFSQPLGVLGGHDLVHVRFDRLVRPEVLTPARAAARLIEALGGAFQTTGGPDFASQASYRVHAEVHQELGRLPEPRSTASLVQRLNDPVERQPQTARIKEQEQWEPFGNPQNLAQNSAHVAVVHPRVHAQGAVVGSDLVQTGNGIGFLLHEEAVP